MFSREGYDTAMFLAHSSTFLEIYDLQFPDEQQHENRVHDMIPCTIQRTLLMIK